ncbi:type 1 fimbrial protein [Salmonella enterica]|nr:type 1 fimbrial protein [Salmonella enterica]ELW6563311.1 type 1 fimbrial protein [Salmonella enterica]ELZ1404530.1 type 1 fimbrial protein [Salmonella enterica]
MNLLIKKIALAVTTCSTLTIASSAMATGHTLQVTGSVTTITCDFLAYDTNGQELPSVSIPPAGIDQTESDEVFFLLKPSSAGCSAAPKVTQPATITWSSDRINSIGIMNSTPGSNENIHIELKPKTDASSAAIAAGGVQAEGVITSGGATVKYSSASDGKTPTATPLPFKYGVKIASNDGNKMKAGNISANLTYMVSYE